MTLDEANAALPPGYVFDPVVYFPTHYDFYLVLPDGTRKLLPGKWREQVEQAVQWAREQAAKELV